MFEEWPYTLLIVSFVVGFIWGKVEHDRQRRNHSA